jgi:hypothetical protein
MFAVENGAVAFLVVHAPLGKCGLGRSARGIWYRLPGAKAHPRTELPARGLNIVETDRFAVLLEHVLNLGGYCQWLGTCQVDAAILKFSVVVDKNRDEAAGLGVLFRAGPLENANGAQHRGILGVFGDLAGILGEGWECGRNKKCGHERASDQKFSDSAQ